MKTFGGARLAERVSISARGGSTLSEFFERLAGSVLSMEHFLKT
jgi:hypothetical protein